MEVPSARCTVIIHEVELLNKEENDKTRMAFEYILLRIWMEFIFSESLHMIVNFRMSNNKESETNDSFVVICRRSCGKIILHNKNPTKSSIYLTEFY